MKAGEQRVRDIQLHIVCTSPGQATTVTTESDWGFAGTLDLVAYVNGKLTTIDHKAAKGIYRDSPPQVASYDYAYNFMVERGLIKGEQTEGSAILRLDKETGFPDYRSYSREQTDEQFGVFVGLCITWHSLETIKENEKVRKKEQRDREKTEKKIIEKTEDPY